MNLIFPAATRLCSKQKIEREKTTGEAFLDGEFAIATLIVPWRGRNHLPLAGSSCARNRTRLHGPCSKAMPCDEPVRDRVVHTAPVRARAVGCGGYDHAAVLFGQETMYTHKKSKKCKEENVCVCVSRGRLERFELVWE